MASSCVCGYTSQKSCNLARHKKQCKISDIIIKKDEQINMMTNELHHMRSSMKNTILELTAELASERKNRVVHNNITIIIPFGQEKRIQPQMVHALLQNPRDSVPMYIKLKHVDNNCNVRINSKESNTLQIIKADEQTGICKWFCVDKNMLADIAETNLDELREQFNAEDVKIWKKWYYENKLDQYGFEETEEWKYMMQRIEEILVNTL